MAARAVMTVARGSRSASASTQTRVLGSESSGAAVHVTPNTIRNQKAARGRKASSNVEKGAPEIVPRPGMSRTAARVALRVPEACPLEFMRTRHQADASVRWIFSRAPSPAATQVTSYRRRPSVFAQCHRRC
jgi:hypothetical protein